MTMFKKKEKKKENNAKNFLDYIPARNIQWETDDSGKVYLIKEKTKNKWLKKIIDWVGKSQNFHIRLDEVGTFTWLAIDGERTVLDISRHLKEAFGEDFKEPEQRVSFFLGMMKKNGFIELFEKVKK